MARRVTTVVVTGRDTNDVGAAVEETRVVGGAWAPPNELDVTVRSEVDAAADAVGAQFGRLDILINNAAAFAEETARWS